jgi:hypothetical protein
MNYTDRRQLNTRVSLMTFYAPEKGYLGGNFMGATPAADPQNLTNFAYKNNYDGSVIKIGNTTKKASFSSNLRPINQLYGALMPRVLDNIKAPACTFPVGSIVKGEAHPLYNYLQAPTSGYTVTYNNVNKNIQALSTGSSTGSTINKITYDCYIPFNDNDINKLSTTYTTYNIWDLLPEYYGSTKICDKYVGPYVDPQFNKGANITVNYDETEGAKIKVSAVDTALEIYRIFPTSKDILYQKPKLFYQPTEGNWSSVDINATGDVNCGFGLKFNNSSVKSTSKIFIRITDKTPIKDTIHSYQLEITSDVEQQLFINKPNSTEFLEYGKLKSLGNIDNITELYFLFVGGMLLIGNQKSPENWEVINPYKSPYSAANKKYEHMISSETYVQVLFYDVDSVFQYVPLAFDHIDRNEQGVNVLQTYITTKLDAPNAKVNAISLSQLQNSVYTNIYYGQNVKPIEQFTHPINVYGDFRTKGSLNVSESGVYANGNESSSNIITAESKGYIDGSIFARLDNNDENTPTAKFNVSSGNSKVDVSLDSIAATINSTSSGTGTSIPILQFVPNGDISEYVESWTVDVTNDENSKYLIHKTASIVLKNLDSDDRGSTIYDLISRNLLVIKIEAGYGNNMETYFEGFCYETNVKKSGTESEFVLNCEDIMYFTLNNIFFENPMLLTGLSIFRSIDYMIACSGMADHYERRSGNNAFNKYGGLVLTPDVPQKQDYLICSVTDKILEKVNQVANLLFNERKAFPTLRWDEQKQKIIFDARDSYLDQDFKFTGAVESATGEYLFNDNKKTTPDWHGLLTGEYSINVNNSNISAAVKSFGLLRDGYKYLSTPELKIENRVSLAKRNQFQNAVDKKNIISGYVGFRKFKIDSQSKNTVANEDILKNRFNFMEKVIIDTFHSISFSCYVTKPLRPYGNFLINILINDKTSQTDPYIYEKVNYSFKKENNYITAEVSGRNVIIPGDY